MRRRAIIEPGYTRALVGLSRGGGYASVVREFDMTTRQFVADGFNLPEAKSDISLGRRKHRAGGYRLRRRLADRFRVSPAGQAVAARDASCDGKDMALANALYHLQHQ